MNPIKQAFNVLLVDRRLPNRVSIPLNNFLYKKRLHGLFEQASQLQPIESKVNANTTLHMLTSTTDVSMAVFSLQSLLRYYTNITVNIYGDQSLTQKDASRIKKSLPNANVALYSDFELKLKSNNELTDCFHTLQKRFTLSPDFAFRAIPWAMKFIIPHLYRKSKRHILLDSDTLFVSRPDVIISWCESDSPNPFHTRPFRPNLRVDAATLATTFPKVQVIPAFNAGFLGFDTKFFPTNYVLDTLRTAITSQLEIFSDECLWRYLFSGVNTTELPCCQYPMLCSTKNLSDLGPHSQIQYFHFHLKHVGGIYYKYGKKVHSELNEDSLARKKTTNLD